MRNKLYTARLEICVLPEQKKMLEKSAAKKKVRMNQLLREIIDNYLS